MTEILLCFQWYSFMAVITHSYEASSSMGWIIKTCLPLCSRPAIQTSAYRPYFVQCPLSAKPLRRLTREPGRPTAFSPAANRGVVRSDSATQAPRMLNSIRNQPEGFA